MKEVLAQHLDACRVSVMRNDPDTIVMTITALGCDTHYFLTRDGFAALTKQLGYDAKLLTV